MLRLTTACAAALLAFCATARASEPPHSAELDDMIVRQAKRHGVPEKLVRRIVMRESKYNPRARNRAYWGLMQISYPTAKSMGFRGSPSELLDPLVNLTYAVPYLANAFIIAGKQEDQAVRLYASGYYATAKSRNLLNDLRTADSNPVGPDSGFIAATTRPVSNLITAVVSGPPPQQAPVEVATQGAPGPVAASGKDADTGVMMATGKKGNEPPKKWLKDGGVTSIARGEQRVEQVAAYAASPGAETPAPSKAAHRSAAAHGKSRKTTEFASLDAPPANAQAYASGVDPRGPEGGPQAAIAQATSAPTQPALRGGDAEVADHGAANQQAAAPADQADTPTPKSAKPKPHKAIAKKLDKESSKVAKSEGGQDFQGDDGARSEKKAVAKPKHAAVKKMPAKPVAVAEKAEEPAGK